MPAAPDGVLGISRGEADIVQHRLVERADLAQGAADLDFVQEGCEEALDARGLGGLLFRGPIAGGGKC